jgi:hypothetical protein
MVDVKDADNKIMRSWSEEKLKIPEQKILCSLVVSHVLALAVLRWQARGTHLGTQTSVNRRTGIGDF